MLAVRNAGWETSSMSHAPSSTTGIGVRIVGVVLTVIFGIPFVFVTGMALSSRFGTAAADPHGYGLIFGTFLALTIGLVLACVVPLMFRPGQRGVAYRWSLVGYVVVAGSLIVSLVTA